MKITGIILAGGESKRMGTNKSTLLYNGKMLIEYPLDLFKNLCDEILISADKIDLKGYQFKTVPDVTNHNGPLSGIYSCLKASSNNVNIVTSCDMPFLSVELYQFLIENSSDYDLVMPFHNSCYEPLFAVYTKKIIPVIESQFLKHEYSPLGLIPLTNFKKLELNEDLDFYNKDIFYNVNTVNDLNYLNKK